MKIALKKESIELFHNMMISQENMLDENLL